jgi:hypothetical protein
MAVSPFLPTLAELRNSEDCKTRQCIWTRKSKEHCPPEQCSRTISDGGKTRKLLQRLQSTEDNQDVLQDLAALQLCGRSHRKKHIGLVLHEWIKETEKEHLKPAILAVSTSQLKSSNAPAPNPTSNQSLFDNDRRTRTITSTQSNHSRSVVTPSIIRQTLQIDEGESLKCHGRTTRNSRCTKPLARLTSIRIDTIIKSLTSSCSVSSDQVEIKHLLDELAKLVLCRGYHQDQAQRLSVQWLPKMADIAISTEADTKNSGHDEETHNPGSPDCRRGSRFDPATPPTIGDSPESTVSSVWSSHPQSRFTTPGTTPHRSASRELQCSSPLSSKTGAANWIESLLEYSDVEHSATDPQPDTSVIRKLFTHQLSKSRKETLRTSHIESPRQTIPAFIPFPTRGIQKMLKDMYDVILRPLSEQHQRFGYIYGFQREDNGYIKIGVTKDVEARMRQWANSCHYKPKVVLKIAVPHAFRVERLIQLHLRNERFRESLSNGLCNSGKGCPRKHEEWFKIGLERLQMVVGMWKRFVESEPYDEKHGLKPWWQQQLKKTDLRSHLDPWLHWLERMLDRNSVMTAKNEEAKENLTRVKVEGKFEVKNSEDGIIIKEEPDNESIPGSTEQEQELRALGRQCRMRIKLEKGVMKENSSKGIIYIIQDSTLSMHVAPLVSAATVQAVFG